MSRAPYGWLAALLLAVAPTAALAAPGDDATIVAAPSGVDYLGTAAASPTCPTGARAVGGGLGAFGFTVGTAPPNTQYLVESAPVDSGGTVSGTITGDVAQGWISAIHNLTGQHQDYRAFVICSRNSDARVEAKAFNASAASQGNDSATCQSDERAVGGGV